MSRLLGAGISSHKLCADAGALDAEAVEKEMQLAALAALTAAAENNEGRAAHNDGASGTMSVKKHKLSADFPAAAAAAGQHLDGEAVEEKSVQDDKSAAQKLSEQIVEQRKLGDSDADVNAGSAMEGKAGDDQPVVEAADQSQATELAALQRASQMAGEAQAADLTVLQQEQQAQQLQLQQQQQPEQQAQQLQLQQQQQQQQQEGSKTQQQQESQTQQLPSVVTQENLLQQQLASQAQQAQTS